MIFILIKKIFRILNKCKNYGNIKLPEGIYNAGSENDLGAYDIAKIVFNELNLTSRIEELLIKNSDKHRDIRIVNEKIKKYDIHFLSTEEAIKKCIKDFSFKI